MLSVVRIEKLKSAAVLINVNLGNKSLMTIVHVMIMRLEMVVVHDGEERSMDGSYKRNMESRMQKCFKKVC